MVTETILNRVNHDSQEILTRLAGISGYLTSRLDSALNTPEKTLELTKLQALITELQAQIKILAPPLVYHITETVDFP
jgi:hypothetical protein